MPHVERDADVGQAPIPHCTKAIGDFEADARPGPERLAVELLHCIAPRSGGPIDIRKPGVDGDDPRVKVAGELEYGCERGNIVGERLIREGDLEGSVNLREGKPGDSAAKALALFHTAG